MVGVQGVVLLMVVATSLYSDVKKNRCATVKGTGITNFRAKIHASDIPQGAQCNLTGVWVNTLGSVLRISAEGSLLKGSLHSSVELAPHSGGDMIGKLLGLVGKGDEPTFTMSITWKGGSVTAWVGQCFQISNCPLLQTMWLLRSEAKIEDNWKATRIGEDVFYPQKKCDVDHV